MKSEDIDVEEMDLYRQAAAALGWCGGSEDFAPGGKARVGWETYILPLIDKLYEASGRVAGEYTYELNGMLFDQNGNAIDYPEDYDWEAHDAALARADEVYAKNKDNPTAQQIFTDLVDPKQGGSNA